MSTMNEKSADSCGNVRAPTYVEIGAVVRSYRRMMDWKQRTLADFAQVSLSSVERVERGLRVSDEILRRLAIALNFEPTDFIRPRRILSANEAFDKAMKFFEGRVFVKTERFSRRSQVERVANAHAILVDDGRCDDATRAETITLREWLRCASFVLGSSADSASRTGKLTREERKDLFDRVLCEVERVERRGYTALMTVYEADMPLMGKHPLGVVAFFPRRTDPAAGKRRHLLAQGSFSREEMTFDFETDDLRSDATS